MMTHQKNEKSLFRVIEENYDTLYFVLFGENLEFFTLREVLESEYLKGKLLYLRDFFPPYRVFREYHSPQRNEFHHEDEKGTSFTTKTRKETSFTTKTRKRSWYTIFDPTLRDTIVPLCVFYL